MWTKEGGEGGVVGFGGCEGHDSRVSADLSGNHVGGSHFVVRHHPWLRACVLGAARVPGINNWIVKLYVLLTYHLRKYIYFI